MSSLGLEISKINGNGVQQDEVLETPQRRDALIARAKDFANRIPVLVEKKLQLPLTSSSTPKPAQVNQPTVDKGARRVSFSLTEDVMNSQGQVASTKEVADLRSEVARLLHDNKELRDEVHSVREELAAMLRKEQAEVESHNTKHHGLEGLVPGETWMSDSDVDDLRQLFSDLDTNKSDTLDEAERKENASRMNEFMKRFNLTADVFADIGDVSFHAFRQHVDAEIRASMQARSLGGMHLHKVIADVIPGGKRDAPLAGLAAMSDDERKNWLRSRVVDVLDAVLVEELRKADAT